MIGAISTALTGLFAATKRVDAAASNIANASSVNYEPVTTVQTSDSNGGTTATNVPRPNGINLAYDPDSPLANTEGYVSAPNVDLAEEAVNLKIAEITYKANIIALRAAENLANEATKLFDKKV